MIFEDKVIVQNFSAIRSCEQNGVTKRQKMTRIKACMQNYGS